MSSKRVMEGIVMIVTGLVTAFVVVTVFGLMADSFMFELLSMDIELTPQFQSMMAYPQQFISLFYWVPLLFSVLLIIWGFKLVIFSHTYTREEDESW